MPVPLGHWLYLCCISHYPFWYLVPICLKRLFLNGLRKALSPPSPCFVSHRMNLYWHPQNSVGSLTCIHFYTSRDKPSIVRFFIRSLRWLSDSIFDGFVVGIHDSHLLINNCRWLVATRSSKFFTFGISIGRHYCLDHL